MGLLNLFAAAGFVLLAVGSVALIYTLQRPNRKTYAYALAKGWPGDPGEQGLVFTEREFKFSDGTATPAWIVEGRNPAGPVVIMSHGWASSRYASLGRMPLLIASVSRLVLYDLRAHGDSTATLCCMGTTEVRDLLDVVEQVAGAGTPIVLYGSSMGAVISIAVAALATTGTHPIAGVIVEAPYRYFVEPIIGQLRLRRLPSFPFAWIATAWMAVKLGGLRGFDRVAHAARLQCPLLVLHGTDDPISRFESGEQIAAAAPGGQLVVFEGGGHSDLAVIDQGRYIQAVDQCLGSIRVASDVGGVTG